AAAIAAAEPKQGSAGSEPRGKWVQKAPCSSELLIKTIKALGAKDLLGVLEFQDLEASAFATLEEAEKKPGKTESRAAALSLQKIGLDIDFVEVQSSMEALKVELGKSEGLLVTLQAAELGAPIQAVSVSLDVAGVKSQACCTAAGGTDAAVGNGVNILVGSDDIDVEASQGHDLAQRQADLFKAFDKLRKTQPAEQEAAASRFYAQ
ncbi:unnamed protein product, partial [Prorocentrum cordatum]